VGRAYQEVTLDIDLPWKYMARRLYHLY